MHIDDRSYWITRVASISASLAIPLVYPRVFAIHNLTLKDMVNSVLPSSLPLSSQQLDSTRVFLLENGEVAFIYAGKVVSADVLQQLFRVQSVDDIPGQFLL